MNGFQFSVIRKMLVICILMILFAAALFIVYKTMIQTNPAEQWQEMNENMRQTLEELGEPMDAGSKEVNKSDESQSNAKTQTQTKTDGSLITSNPMSENKKPTDIEQNMEGTGKSVAPADTLLDLNQATADQLDGLPYIGPSKAQAIIAWRNQNGLFQQIDDVMEVKGIGPKIFEKIKALITVEKK